jgi:oxygen-independent coproporphyrinogen III oxidase
LGEVMRGVSGGVGPGAAESVGNALGLYVHIPFCVKKCGYCDFASWAGQAELFAGYVGAVCREIEDWGCVEGAAWNSVFVGGGTPTCLPPELLERVLSACRRRASGGGVAEVTTEANPGTVDLAYLGRLVRAGVNRLSLGVQSFDEAELSMLGRVHGACDAVRAVRNARDAGFGNVNLDLIYGLPRQGMEAWRRSLDMALELRPEHLSLYALSLEEHTPLWREVKAGRLSAPDDDLAADMYSVAEDVLGDAGYDHYELSNWAARPQFRCKHNLKYWQMEPYVGVGASAHSCGWGRRWWNVRTPGEYIERMSSASTRLPGSVADLPRLAIAGEEIVTPEMALGETLFLGLRTSDGVSSTEVEVRFGVTLRQAYGERIRRLVRLGLVESDGERLRLTRRGRLLGNRVFAEFVGDPDVVLPTQS